MSLLSPVGRPYRWRSWLRSVKTSQVTFSPQSTTAGAYTFTVKGTDVINPSTTTTATVTVAVE
jgi:hypothetical protein